MAAVGRNAVGFHLPAAGDGGAGDVRSRRKGSPRRGGQLGAGVVRHHIAGHAAPDRDQLPGPGLVQLHRIALVQDALFAVDERVFAIGRKTQHRDLAAVVAVIEDIPVVGLLV